MSVGKVLFNSPHFCAEDPTNLSSTFGLLAGDDLADVLGDEGAALDVLHRLHAPPAAVGRSGTRWVTSYRVTTAG